MKYLLFFSTFLLITHWWQAKLLLADFSFSKKQVDYIQDDFVQGLVLSNTGHEIKNVKLINTDKPYGMMIGIPGKPQLVLSKGLYDSFEKSELEYVLLHESAHYKYSHTLQQLVLFVIFVFTGMLVLRSINLEQNKIIFLNLLLGLVLGIIYLQIAKIHEYQADRYAAKHIFNPQGMIDATNKFKNYYGNKQGSKILYMIFYRAVPYEDRIKIAEERL